MTERFGSSRVWLTVVLLATASLGAACVDIGNETAPSRFYVLSAIDSPSPPSAEGVALLIGPITLPRYLDRPQIVTRPSPNELALAEYDRWGGKLDDNFARVLAQDLAVHLNTSRIAYFPRDQRLAEAIQVSIDVSRFEQLSQQGHVALDAQWTLYPAERRGPPLIGTSRITVPVTGQGFPAIAGAMSAAIDKLAQDLTAAARKMPQGRGN